MTKFSVVLERPLTQKRDQKKNLDFIKKRAVSGARGAQGWKVVNEKELPVEQVNNLWVSRYLLTFEKVSGHRNNADLVKRQWDEVEKFLFKICEGSKWGEYKWAVRKDQNEQRQALEVEDKPEEKVKAEHPKDAKGFYKIEPKWDGVFDHLYNLSNPIQMLSLAIETAVETSYEVRPHTLLAGPPACGKTTMLEAAVKSLGPEDVAYFRLDATSTTKAGIEKKLLDKENPVPPIMVIEELEKVENVSILKFLLGLLDERCEMNKMNYRIGHSRREVKLLCLATVNDMEKLEGSHAGAVASRFTNEIYCPRPSRDVLGQILLREVNNKFPKVKHREDWIEPTLKYVYDEEKCTDPRRANFVCLVGRDRLLDGSFQEALAATRIPKES